MSCGSSSVPGVIARGQSARWIALLLLVGVAAAAAWSARGPRVGRSTVLVGGLASALVLLAVLSSAWSITPRLTFERAVSLGALVVAALAFAYASPARQRLAGALLIGVIAGASVVALLGLVVLALAHGDAVQAATAIAPWRYRGFGQNPNTVPMLAAVALPLCAWSIWSGRARALGIGAGLLLLGTMSFSGSRGALLAGAAGVAVFGLAVSATPKARVTAVATAAAVIAASLVLGQLSSPNPQAQPVTLPAPPPATITTPGAGGGKGSGGGGQPAKVVPDLTVGRLEDELGRPGATNDPVRKPSIFSSSGRLQAWIGALHTGNSHPLLGFGFGTEDRAFVDRYYSFQGSRPENSWIGMYLQLGAAGVLLLGCLAIAVGLAAFRALRGDPLADVGVRGGAAGVVAAALVLTLVQSYIYSVGNVATVTVWISMLLLAATTDVRRQVAVLA